jgi:hypothetical protein
MRRARTAVGAAAKMRVQCRILRLAAGAAVAPPSLHQLPNLLAAAVVGVQRASPRAVDAAKTRHRRVRLPKGRLRAAAAAVAVAVAARLQHVPMTTLKRLLVGAAGAVRAGRRRQQQTTRPLLRRPTSKPRVLRVQTRMARLQRWSSCTALRPERRNGESFIDIPCNSMA